MMDYRYPALFCLLICFLPPLEAALPVLSGEASAARRLEALQPTSCYVADLAKGDGGDLCRIQQTLAPGRYRLHGSFAAAPLGKLITGTVRLKIEAPGVEDSYALILLPGDDRFVPFQLDFSATSQPVELVLSWYVIQNQKDKNLKDQRALELMQGSHTGDLPEPALKLDDELDELAAFDLSEGDLVPLTEAQQKPHRLLAAGLHLQPLAPVQVQALKLDKIVYRPGDPIRGTAILRNHGGEPQTLQPRLELTTDLATSRTLTLPEVTVPGGETVALTLPDSLSTAGLQWGADLTIVLPGEPAASATESFAVHDNFWAVHQYQFIGSLAEYQDKARAERAVATWREQGYTALEALFWAPDDMFDYTPESEWFFGGQGGYPATITATRNIVEACQRQGLAFTFYANWWGGGGPPAFEMMRQHPEWFANANYQTHVLADWDLLGYHAEMAGGEVKAPGVEWCYVPMAMPPFPGAFSTHAVEIVASQRMFGWDAIRYDSAYSSDWNVKGMRRVRQEVSRDVPSFSFAMNSFALQDARTHQMPNFRGGCIMGEGLRLERKKHLKPWMAELLDWRDVCWPYDIQVMPLYRDSTDEEQQSPLDQVLATAAHYAAGGHLGASPPETDLGSLAPFSRRYSQLLWDTRLRVPLAVDSLVQAPSILRVSNWRRLVRVRQQDEGQRLILHRVNVPGTYRIFQGYGQQAPAPLAAETLTLNLPEGLRIQQAWTVDPFAQPQTATAAVTGNQVDLPETRFWQIVVVDLAGEGRLPVRPNHRDLSATYIRTWHLSPPQTIAREQELPQLDVLDIPTDTLRSWPEHTFNDLPCNLDEAIGEPNRPWSSIYAAAIVASDQARETTLFIKADDAAAVWVNGHQVLAKDLGPFEKQRETSVPIELQAGDNTILVKISQRWLGWQFVLRLGDEEMPP